MWRRAGAAAAPRWSSAWPWRSPGGGHEEGAGAEQEQVPEAEFRSYYGQPILKMPRWKEPHLPAYLYLGGLSGASAVMGAAAAARPAAAALARAGPASPRPRRPWAAPDS